MVKLTARSVEAAKKPGRYGDGDGLYLVVSKNGSKSWVIRIQKSGRRRDFGLGGIKKKSLADARADAQRFRRQTEAGLDPIAERKKSEEVPTFREAAKLVHAEHKKGWRNGKHNAQWLRTLEVYAFPDIGKLSVAEIEHRHVRDLLATIWIEKPETARRVFQRVRTVLDWAFAKQYREIELPTRGALKGLPRQNARVEHFRALSCDDVPGFVQVLREKETVSRLALEALILTGTRSGSLRKATWDQIDLDLGVWEIPGEIMKGGESFTVPLSPTAIDVFRRARAYRLAGVDLVFPGRSRGQPLSENTLNVLVERLGFDATAHGFRSSFRDFATERTNHPAEVAEAALGHVVGDKVVAAYLRSNLMDRRRLLMDDWARHCEGSSGKVVRLFTG